MTQATANQVHGPLQGYKVIDLTRMLPGPFGTMMLADFGAEVTVIEQPSGPALGPRRKNFHVDRNKRSIALNLKDGRAQDILYKLVAEADVFVEGFRPGVTERLGIDYAKLKELNPGLVYCSISGYGQDGPYRLRVGHDLNYLAAAGLLLLNGSKDTGPVVPASQFGDIAAGGLIAAFSILAAMLHREKTGQGQYIDVSMTDGAMILNPAALFEYYTTGKPPEPQSYRTLGSTPCYNIYQAQDGQYISIGALEPKFWVILCNLLERPDLIERQYEEGPGAIGELQEIFAAKPREHWDRLLESEDVCYAPVAKLDETCQDPQMLARGMYQEVTWPDGQTSPQVGVVPQLSETPGTLRTPPFSSGQHGYEILADLGLDKEAIAQLEEEGVFAVGQ